MADEPLFTAGKIAKELGVPDAKVKKVIQELGLEPVQKKGPCNYFSAAQMAKVKKAI